MVASRKFHELMAEPSLYKEVMMRALFRLSLPVHAVRPSQHGTGGIIIEIPAGNVLEVQGESKIAGLVDVRCNGQLYSVFPQDLQDRAEQMVQALSASL
jgi:hypothetical protein